MKRLGRGLHVSRQGILVLKGTNVPKIRESVVDSSTKEVGVVVDIFGPLNSPYVAVALSRTARRRNDLLQEEFFARMARRMGREESRAARIRP